MKERPILMSSPMVSALLEGRKTQTRRIVKPQPVPNHRGRYKFTQFTDDEGIESYWHIDPFWTTRCPYGQPGDRLWVKETHARYHTVNHIVHSGGRAFSEVSDGLVAYKADGFDTIDDLKQHIRLMSGSDMEAVEVENDRWRPSIFMPRWASRILLEITEVRVERLQDISEEDAKAEGIRLLLGGGGTFAGREGPGKLVTPWMTAIEAYRDIWEAINGTGSWDLNPFVWAISFKRIDHDQQ